MPSRGSPVELLDDLATACLQVRAARPDLIVVDIDLRGALGLIQHLKGDPTTRAIPILAVCGRDGGAGFDALNAVADGFVRDGEVAVLRQELTALLRLNDAAETTPVPPAKEG
jgi:CheY-like chemotaxis protein